MSTEAPEEVLTCNGFDVWVSVDDKKTQNYGMEHDEGGKKAVCWIPSEEGKELSITIQRKVSNVDMVIIVYLDGKLVSNAVWQKHSPNSTKIWRVWVSGNSFRKFAFGSLELTDDDAYLDNSPTQNVGSIKIELSSCNVHGASENQAQRYPTTDGGKMHERSKKGLTHRVKYGPLLEEKCPSPLQVTKYGEVTTFLFNYRPLAFLQATGVAPPMLPLSQPEHGLDHTLTPLRTHDRTLPSVKSEEIDTESEDDEETAAKEKELLAQLEALRSKKRSRQGGEHPKKKVKTEPVAHFAPGEVIDLTI